MNAPTLTPAEIRVRLDQIRERLAVVSADRWSHEFREDGEHIIVTRAVIDRDGRRVGDEAPVVLCTFGPEAAWQEAELVREARHDIGFLLDLLTDAGRTIRDLRSASRDAPAASPPVAPAGPRTGSDGRSPLPLAAGGDADGSADGAALPSPQGGEGGRGRPVDDRGRMRGDADAPKNFATEASMKCAEVAFQAYLRERYANDDDGDLSDSAASAAVLRRALGIGSRKDLNTDPDAAARWRDMRADFGEWMRG